MKMDAYQQTVSPTWRLFLKQNTTFFMEQHIAPRQTRCQSLDIPNGNCVWYWCWKALCSSKFKWYIYELSVLPNIGSCIALYLSWIRKYSGRKKVPKFPTKSIIIKQNSHYKNDCWQIICICPILFYFQHEQKYYFQCVCVCACVRVVHISNQFLFICYYDMYFLIMHLLSCPWKKDVFSIEIFVQHIQYSKLSFRNSRSLKYLIRLITS